MHDFVDKNSKALYSKKGEVLLVLELAAGMTLAWPFHLADTSVTSVTKILVSHLKQSRGCLTNPVRHGAIKWDYRHTLTGQRHLLFPGIPRRGHWEPSWTATQRLWRPLLKSLLTSGLEKSQICFQQSRVKASDILTMKRHSTDKIWHVQLNPCCR